MKTIRNLIVAVGILTAIGLTATAQTNVVTETNVVTVLVTNVVTVTNVVASVPAPAPAPVAVDLVKQYPWESSLSAGLTLTRGNSHTLLYSGDFQTAKKTPDNEYSLGLAGAYGSQNSVDNVNNYKTFGQWNHLFSEKFFGYVRADASRDLIASLDYRFDLGPGVGYYLIKNKTTTLATEAGAGYQDEHFRNVKLGVNTYKSFATVRLAERFEHKFSDRARLWQTLEVLPQVDNFDNYAINFEIGLEASISKSFSLKTYLDDSYQKEPAAGSKKNDIRLVSGVVYKF